VKGLEDLHLCHALSKTRAVTHRSPSIAGDDIFFAIPACHAHLANVLMALDAVQRQIHIGESSRIHVLLLGALNERLGIAAKVIAVRFVARRLEDFPFRFLAKKDQLVSVFAKVVKIVGGNGLQNFLRILSFCCINSLTSDSFFCGSLPET
jgi:hypothetical protein